MQYLHNSLIQTSARKMPSHGSAHQKIMQHSKF